MPTYQYTCTACGHELEAVQSFSDPALTECPQCQGALRKLFSAVGVVFKGSGFYKTDSRSSSTPSSSGSSGESKPASGDSSAASSSSSSSTSSSSTGSAAKTGPASSSS